MEGDELNTSPPQARNGQNDQGNRSSKTEIIAISIQVLRMKIESLVLTEITFCERIACEPKTISKKCRRHPGKSNPDESANDLVTSGYAAVQSE